MSHFGRSLCKTRTKHRCLEEECTLLSGGASSFASMWFVSKEEAKLFDPPSQILQVELALVR